MVLMLVLVLALLLALLLLHGQRGRRQLLLVVLLLHLLVLLLQVHHASGVTGQATTQKLLCTVRTISSDKTQPKNECLDTLSMALPCHTCRQTVQHGARVDLSDTPHHLSPLLSFLFYQD